jgi:ABC-type amino acid transport substrate-binding protein
MKKVKQIAAVALAAVLAMGALSGCSKYKTLEDIQKEGTIVMYTNAEFAPFEYMGDGNQVSGVDVDIANEIAKDLGVKLQIENVAFDTIIGAIQSGKGDFGAAGMTVTAEREKQVDFSVKYVKSRQYIVQKADSNLNTLDDLKGKKIGVQLGTTGDLIIDDNLKAAADREGTEENGVLFESGATLKQYGSAPIAAADIATGKLDCVVVDELPAKSIAEKNEGYKAVEMTYADGSTTEEEYAFCVAKGNKTLLDAINKTMQRLMDEGKIDEYVLNHTTK